jgi:hypothetical protein
VNLKRSPQLGWPQSNRRLGAMAMQLFIDFWKHHCPALSPEAMHYLLDSSELLYLDKHRHLKLPMDPAPYYYVVLKGLVVGYERMPTGKLELLEVLLPYRSLPGTKHLFSDRHRPIELIAARASIVLRIPLRKLRAGQGLYVDISLLTHVWKQHRMDDLAKQVILFHQKEMKHRYRLFVRLFPHWVEELPKHIQMEFLSMSKTNFYRILRK